MGAKTINDFFFASSENFLSNTPEKLRYSAQWARVHKKAEFNKKYEMPAIMAQNMAEMYRVFE